MSKDDEIYLALGLVLRASAPIDAKRLVVEVELSPEADHGKFLFDYFDGLGEKRWYVPASAETDAILLTRLAELRHFFAQSELFLAGKPWIGCVLDLELSGGILKVVFRYE